MCNVKWNPSEVFSQTLSVFHHCDFLDAAAFPYEIPVCATRKRHSGTIRIRIRSFELKFELILDSDLPSGKISPLNELFSGSLFRPRCVNVHLSSITGTETPCCNVCCCSKWRNRNLVSFQSVMSCLQNKRNHRNKNLMVLSSLFHDSHPGLGRYRSSDNHPCEPFLIRIFTTLKYIMTIRLESQNTSFWLTWCSVFSINLCL